MGINTFGIMPEQYNEDSRKEHNQDFNIIYVREAQFLTEYFTAFDI